MRCRKKDNDVRSGSFQIPGGIQGEPVYCLDGVRHKGGVNLNQALVWNVGTCRPDAKGETQMGGLHKGESTDAGHRGGPTRSSVEVSVMEMERRGWIIRLYFLVNQRWEEPRNKAKPLNKWLDDTSRMTGDCHVRFCEGLGGKFPRPTRLDKTNPAALFLLWVVWL